jgi:hypothetical protein
MAKATLGNRKSFESSIKQNLKNLAYDNKKSPSLDEVLGMLPLEQMRKDIEELKNKPQVMEIQQPERIIEHHVKTVSVTHENTKTIDKRARNYAKEVRRQTKLELDNLVSKMWNLHEWCEKLEARKPEEKQVVTVETRTVETIKEIEYKLDKRVIVALSVSLIINVLILIFK